jgi:hypothetical protein
MDIFSRRMLGKEVFSRLLTRMKECGLLWNGRAVRKAERKKQKAEIGQYSSILPGVCNPIFC